MIYAYLSPLRKHAVIQYLFSLFFVPKRHSSSGETYDWSKLKVPKGASRKGWILAGGLDPDNVAKAMKVALPNGVDVSTGVTLADGVKKARGLPVSLTSKRSRSLVAARRYPF